TDCLYVKHGRPVVNGYVGTGRWIVARRTAEEAERTRQAIVAAARALFTAHGYAGTATATIVEAAGVTRGALYHHLADKAAVFEAVFTELVTERDDTVNRAAGAERPAYAAFATGCRALLDFVVRPDYHQIAVLDAPAVLGPDQWHAIDAGLGLDTVELGLKALAGEGRLRMAPSRALAIAVFGA